MKNVSLNWRRLVGASLCIFAGAVVSAGCSDNESDPCTEGEVREFVCGGDRQGRQPQQCVDGAWFSTSFCALPDGTPHPDDPTYTPGPGGGEDAAGRPTDPSTCVKLTDPDVNGGKTLAAGTCYHVESTLTVDDGVLTIEPKVTLFFDQDAGMTITGGGRLRAIGAASKSVWFQGKVAERGYWKGLVFEDTGSGEHVLEHVLIRGGGGIAHTGNDDSRGGVYVYDGEVKLSVKNATFENNAFAGLTTFNHNARIAVSATTFRGNHVPMHLNAAHLGDLGDDLVFVGNKDEDDNARDVIVLLDGSDAVSRKATWPAYTYEIMTGVTLENALTIKPGAVLRFASDRRLEVNGAAASLSAIGTAEKPIVFSSIAQRRGTWNGIYFNESSAPENRLEHVRVEYGGENEHTGNGLHRGGVYIGGSSAAVFIRNSAFVGNDHAGLTSYGREGAVTIDATHFADNVTPLVVGPQGLGWLGSDVTFENNDNDYILVGNYGGTTVEANATWPTLSVPYMVETVIAIEAVVVLTPGSQFIFADTDHGISVETSGALTADAMGEPAIIFEGTEDLPGMWRGLHFKSRTTANVLNNVEILNAGSEGWHGGGSSQAALFLRYTAIVSIDGSRIASSMGYGISTDDTSSLTGCDGLSFTNNALADFFGNVDSIGDCN